MKFRQFPFILVLLLIATVFIAATKKSQHFLLRNEKIPPAKLSKFVNRFLDIAIAEKYKYNIPIAVKLTQGVIESAYGTSELTRRSNNFFGHKCKERCFDCNGKKWERRGNCINATDDSKRDLFRVFPTAWESWRTHSELLTITRYRKLLKLHPTNYKDWAKGLLKAGYASDKNYAKSIINYIETYDLGRFDRIPVEVLAKMRGVDLSKITKYKHPDAN